MDLKPLPDQRKTFACGKPLRLWKNLSLWKTSLIVEKFLIVENFPDCAGLP